MSNLDNSKTRRKELTDVLKVLILAVAFSTSTYSYLTNPGGKQIGNSSAEEYMTSNCFYPETSFKQN